MRSSSGMPDLTDDETAALTPLLVLTDRASLDGAGQAGLSRLLASELPVKILLLDGYEPGMSFDPVLTGLTHRDAFVVSSSIAHPEHLFESLQSAVDYPGPALLHLYAPETPGPWFSGRKHRGSCPGRRDEPSPSPADLRSSDRRRLRQAPFAGWQSRRGRALGQG